MQLVNQEPADDGTVRLVVKAEPAEVERAADEVYRDVARRASVPGFRKGKAPRALLEQQVSPDEARRMAVDDMAPAAVAEGLREAGIEPFVRPDLEKADLEDDGSATFVASVTPRPKVELGEYRGLAVVRPAIEVTDEQVETQLDRVRERYARYEPVQDRPAQAGDLALVDYDLEAEGQVVEGQSTHGYPSQIGNDSLFPELNEKLPGMKPGEQIRIPAAVPEDHADAAVAGKQGEYVVTLRELKRRVVPELTDEMAQEAHNVSSAQELRDATRGLLERLAREEAEDRLHGDLLDKVMEGARVSVPAAIVRAEARARLERFEEELRARGRSLEDYLDERHMDAERWLRNEEMQARMDLERMLALEEVGRREGIEVSQEKLSDEIAGIARRTGSSADRVRKALRARGMDRLADRVRHDKVLQFLVDHADITGEGEAAAEPAAQPDSEAREEQS